MHTRSFKTTEDRLTALLGADPQTLDKVDRILSGGLAGEMNIPRPVCIAEAARLLGKSRATVHRWVKTGTIRAVRPAGGCNQLIPFFEIERLAGGLPRAGERVAL